MPTTNALLLALIVLVICSAARSEWRHKRLVRMITDLATMAGDAFDAILED